MSPKKQFYYDLHVHTSRYSACSRMSPEEAIHAALQRGLDGIVLTEHFHVWSPEEIIALKQNAKCPGFCLLAGCEISTESQGRRTGDVLVFGAKEIPDNPCSIDEICRIAHQDGGIVIAAHPYADMVGMGDEVCSARIDGIEVANFRYDNPIHSRGLEEIGRELHLAGIASSDAHSVEEVGRFCMECSEPIRSIDDLVRVIRGGLCKPRLKSPPGMLRRFLKNAFSAG